MADADLTLSASEVALMRRFLDRAATARPRTVAGEHDHYVALVGLSAIVAMVLDDAAERAES